MSTQSIDNTEKKTKWGLAGAIVGAVAASVCCVVPLVLLALGISGAWVSSLTVLQPYRPIFIIVTLLFLGYAFYRVYRKPKEEDCEPGSYCANPKSDRINKIALWTVTLLVIGLLVFPYLVPMTSQASTATPVTTPVKTEKVVLSVQGMTCNGCVLTVTKSLKKVDGVTDAMVTLEPPIAVVKYDPTEVSVEQLIETTTNAGYPSKVKER